MCSPIINIMPNKIIPPTIFNKPIAEIVVPLVIMLTSRAIKISPAISSIIDAASAVFPTLVSIFFAAIKLLTVMLIEVPESATPMKRDVNSLYPKVIPKR